MTHRHISAVCPCGAVVQACAQLGRIPVWAVCVSCAAEYTIRLEDGEQVLDKLAPPNQEPLPWPSA